MVSGQLVRMFAAVEMQMHQGTHFASNVNACSPFKSGGKDGVEVMWKLLEFYLDINGRSLRIHRRRGCKPCGTDLRQAIPHQAVARSPRKHQSSRPS